MSLSLLYSFLFFLRLVIFLFSVALFPPFAFLFSLSLFSFSCIFLYFHFCFLPSISRKMVVFFLFSSFPFLFILHPLSFPSISVLFLSCHFSSNINLYKRVLLVFRHKTMGRLKEKQYCAAPIFQMKCIERSEIGAFHIGLNNSQWRYSGK